MKKPTPFSLIPVISLLLAAALTVTVQAAEIVYEAPLEDSRWVLQGTRLQCALTHDIPNYGTAHFVHEAGGDLHFYLDVKRSIAQDSEALLVSAPPQWKHDATVAQLGKVTLNRGKVPFWLEAPEAKRLAYELQKGMDPMFFFKDHADQRDDVRVVVSTVNFKKSYGDFRDCQENLLKYGFEDVRNTEVYFDTGLAFLDADSRNKLNRIITYLELDPLPITVEVIGHTDEVGKAIDNDYLSVERAYAVKEYLLNHGVDAGKLETKFYGESQPVASNKMKDGRARNRRVLVSLQKPQSSY